MDADKGLMLRARAARELIAERQIDPLLALSYVIAPGPDLEEATCGIDRPKRTAEQRAQALALIDQGVSQRVAGAAVGVSKGTVQGWVDQRRVAA